MIYLIRRFEESYATDLHCRVIYHLVNELNTLDYRTAQVLRMFMSWMY